MGRKEDREQRKSGGMERGMREGRAREGGRDNRHRSCMYTDRDAFSKECEPFTHLSAVAFAIWASRSLTLAASFFFLCSGGR